MWTRTRAAITKRLEDRLEKYGAVNADGTIDTKRIGVNRFMPVLTDGKVDHSRGVMNIGGMVVNSNQDGIFTIFDKDYLEEK